MSPLLVIALREYLAAVRTRSFWLGIAAVPLLAALALVFVVLLQQAEPPLRFAIVDASGWLDDQLSRQLLVERAVQADAPTPDPDALMGPQRTAALSQADAWLLERRRFERVRGMLPAARDPATELPADLFAVLTIPPDPLSGKPLQLRLERRTRPEFESWLRRAVHDALLRVRLEDAGLAPARLPDLLAEPRIDIAVAGAADDDGRRALTDMAPLAWVYALTLAIMAMTHRLLTSTVDERTSRLLDVMLSIVEPRTLLAGKLLGLAAVGMTLGASWLIWPLGLTALAPTAPGMSTLGELFGPGTLLLFLSYFLLAYLLYGLWLAAFGAFCRDIRDANNLLAPAQVLLLTPLLLMLPIVRDPTGWLAVALSWVPPLTPFVMMNRLAAPPTTAELLGTQLLLLATIALSWPLASALFRRGLTTPVGSSGPWHRFWSRAEADRPSEPERS